MSEGRLIYRHYAKPEEFAAYARGVWQGHGMHGRADWPQDTEIDVRIDSGSAFRIRGIRRRKLSGFARLLSRLRREGERAFDVSVENFEHLKTEADLAVIESAAERITLQAMTADRCHVMVEGTGSHPTLIFSGVVRKK